MSYDFWNNPLVVSAFRRKYRRSGPSQNLILYPLTLLLIGMAIAYFAPDVRRDWPRIGFIALLSVQTLVSGLAAAVSTAASMKSEVAKQTLDFQRLSSLSPRQILLGKLFGESAMAFLLAISIFPLAFFCWISAGFAPELFVLAFVNLAAHISLSGSTGLVQPLEARDGKTSEGVLWLTSVPAGIPALAVLGMALFNAPAYLYSTLLGWLCFLPAAQIVMAFVSFHIMERRLENPLNPAIAKPLSYVLLILIDLTAIVFFQLGPGSFGQHWVGLTLTHLIACSILISGVTPVRETSRSWVWRFRGRRSRILDSLLANRAENGMAVVVYAVIGVLTLLLQFGITLLRTQWEEIDPEGAMPMIVAGLLVLLVLSYGITYQFFLFQLGRKGASAFSGFVFVVVFVPLMAAGMLDAMAGMHRPLGQHEPLAEWLLSITPAAHFVQWIGRTKEGIHLAPMVVVYVAFLLGFWIALRSSMRSLEAEVDRKLVSMGVQPPRR